MDYLPHVAQVLYLRVLRRRMDFSTGIVGITCRISYQLIGEWLEVRPPWGSKNPIVRLTVSEIRAALAQLEKAGLINRVRDGKGDVIPLVFSMPLARTGLVYPKKERQEEQQQNQKGTTAKIDAVQDLKSRQRKLTNSNIYDIKNVVDKLQKQGQKKRRNNSKIEKERQEERQTSGVSGLSGHCLINNLMRDSRGNDCLVPDDWLPSDYIVDRIISDFGLPKQFLVNKAVEFRFFWAEAKTIATDWDKYFYGACKNKISEGNGEFLTAITLAAGGEHG